MLYRSIPVIDRNMNGHYGNSRASSSSPSSLNSSSQGTEDDHAIAKILEEEEEIASRYGGKLGNRLSHLDSIPVQSYLLVLDRFSMYMT